MPYNWLVISAQLSSRPDALERRKRISELAIDVFIVRPIPHRMQYDRDHLYVQAGKPFEIIFDNTDIMPHNLVVTRPDSREESRDSGRKDGGISRRLCKAVHSGFFEGVVRHRECCSLVSSRSFN